MDLPITSMSGSRPQSAVSPPGPATRVWVSSITSSAPLSAVSRRNAAWKPSAGWITPVLVTAASARTQATSPRASSRSTASRSLYCTRRTCRVASTGTPRPSGATLPASSSPSSSSAWPWYLPSNISTTLRPVAARATRIASVFAWVAESVNCQDGSPKRRASSIATSTPSSVGSRNCDPAATRSVTARTTASTP